MYLQVDLDKLIQIIYDSNISKLCDIDTATNSVIELSRTKGIDVIIQKSPVWGAFEKPAMGDKPKIYYLCERDGRIRKPLTFKEPNFNLY